MNEPAVGDALDWLHEQGKRRARTFPEFDPETTLRTLRAARDADAYALSHSQALITAQEAVSDARSRTAMQKLAAGQAFHKQVQSAFLSGLTGAAGFPERQWRLLGQRRGRVDLAVEVDGEQMLVIIEIKGTNWDLIPAGRLMRNLRRHLHQLQGYLDSAMEDMEVGRWASIAGALLYPARPTSSEITAVIERIAGEQAIMVTWYEDVDWRQ